MYDSVYDVRVKVYRCASIFIRAHVAEAVCTLCPVFTDLILLVTHHLLSFLASSTIAIYHVSNASYTSGFN